MSLSLFDFHRQLDKELFGQDFWSRAAPNVNVPSMRMELKERPKAYELTVEAPGVNKDEMKISCDQSGVLMVSVERHEEKTGSDDRVHFSERHYGHCSRRIRLPPSIDAGSITAKYENGVVRIEIPKTEKHQPNLIRIE